MGEGYATSESTVYKALFDGLGEMPDIHLDNDVVETKKFFLEYMTRIGERFRAAGEQDGLIGQRNYAIAEIVRTRVLQIQSYLASTFGGELDRAEVDVKIREEALQRSQREYDSQKDYEADLKRRYRNNFKEFSRGLGWIYVIAALVLVAADYPLALKLTKDGFQLTEWWSTPLMSLGLALSTLYIKIFYDEFVGSSAEQSVRRFADLPGISGDDITKVKRSWWSKSFIKTAILVLSLSTIVVLGFFRFQVYEPTLKDFFKGPGQNPDDYGNYVNSLTKGAFILITLLFPLIGGVCASLGFDRLQNNKENRKVANRSAVMEAALLRASKDLEAAKRRRKVCESYIEWCETGGDARPRDSRSVDDVQSRFVRNYTGYFIACYTHGYERGLARNDQGKDVFAKAFDFRRIALGERITKLTIKTTPEDLYEQVIASADPAI
jgi:hypothetical protein